MGLLDRFFGPEREGRRLLADARYILNALREGDYLGAKPDTVARELRDELAFATEQAQVGRYGPSRALERLKTRHQEARHRRDQHALTSLTLALIYINADKAGVHGRPARQEIESFMAEWAHAMEPEASAAPAAAPAAAQELQNQGAGQNEGAGQNQEAGNGGVKSAADANGGVGKEEKTS